MIPDDIRKHLESLSNNPFGVGPGMPIDEALEAGIEALVLWGGDRNIVAARVLMMILDQRGCEHMDCGPHGEGRLTEAISVCVFG